MSAIKGPNSWVECQSFHVNLQIKNSNKPNNFSPHQHNYWIQHSVVQIVNVLTLPRPAAKRTYLRHLTHIECHYAVLCFIYCFAECRYTERYFYFIAECRYAECRGVSKNIAKTFSFKNKQLSESFFLQIMKIITAKVEVQTFFNWNSSSVKITNARRLEMNCTH